MSTRLPRDEPGAKGVDPAGLVRFLDAASAAGLELHSFLLYRGGAVVTEAFWRPYSAERPHMQHSATKSWTATAVGMALAAGKMRLDDTVASFFPDQLPASPGANLLAMTVRDLLTMRTGHATGISGGEWRGLTGSWVRAFLHEAVPERPGETFIYSSGSSYMLSAIVTAVTGETAHALLDRAVLRPLGMGPVQWDLSPEGISTGGNGLSCTSEDSLKFGVLHLNDGVWDGQRILPAGWVAEATTPHVAEARLGAMDGRRYAAPGAPDGVKRHGYGYQWWMTPFGGYRASGIFGQYCIVLPGHDAVAVFTGALQRGEPRLLELVWRHLVPALTPAALRGPVPDFAGLALPDPAGDAAGRTGAMRYAVDGNAAGVTALGLLLEGGRCVFTLEDGRGLHRIAAGMGVAIEGETTMTGSMLHHEYQPPRMRVLARAVWQREDRLCMTWRFIETPFCDTVLLDFSRDGVVMRRSVNTNAGLLALPAISGRSFRP